MQLDIGMEPTFRFEHMTYIYMPAGGNHKNWNYYLVWFLSQSDTLTELYCGYDNRSRFQTKLVDWGFHAMWLCRSHKPRWTDRQTESDAYDLTIQFAEVSSIRERHSFDRIGSGAGLFIFISLKCIFNLKCPYIMYITCNFDNASSLNPLNNYESPEESQDEKMIIQWVNIQKIYGTIQNLWLEGGWFDVNAWSDFITHPESWPRPPYLDFQSETEHYLVPTPTWRDPITISQCFF